MEINASSYISLLSNTVFRFGKDVKENKAKNAVSQQCAASTSLSSVTVF